MLKFFSFSKINAGVLVTLLVLIVLGASYFFVYLPANEKVVQERRFRSLRKIDTNIRAKMENSFAQIKNLVKNYDQSSAASTNVTDYIKKYPKDNFTLLLPGQANQYFNKDKKKQPLPIEEDPSENIKFYIDVGSQFTLLARHKVNTTWNAIGIQFEFENFFKPLLSPDDFDNYVVFINDQKHYESFPSGLNYAVADSLLTVKNKISTPGVRSIKIGETDYKAFSHPLYTYTGYKWIVTGLVSGNNYEKERSQLPLWILLLLLTAAIAMLVSLPWIKLYHMGNKDRLTSTEAIESVLVSMILMSLLFFVIFKYHPDFNLKEKQLRNAYSRNMLATKITNAFRKEIDTAYNLLNSFDKIHQISDTDIFLLGKKKQKEKLLKYKELFTVTKNGWLTVIKDGKSLSKVTLIPDSLFTKYDTLFKKHPQGIDVSQIFWLDHYGSERTNLTVDSNNDPKGHYDYRNYFKNAIASRYNKTGSSEFYIDQIVSHTENTFKSVISKKTKDSVAVLALRVKSLDSVIMPDGYQFAIIDVNGRVLYHSKPNRNLNENLKNEFADSSQLVSSIQAQSDTSFKAEYYGRRYNVKIKPVADLPYFTIIFEDLEYNDMRDTEACSFTLSMLIFMLVFVSIRYGLVFFSSSRRSFLKKHHFDTSWIGPHVKCHHEYNLAIVANLSTILLLIILFNYASFLEYLYILLVSVVFTSLFLTVVFADKYKNTDRYKYKFKISAIKWLSAFVLVIDTAAYFHLTGTDMLFLLLYEMVLAGIYSIIFFYRSSLTTRAFKFFAPTFTHSYAFMITTRLIISSGIPVAFFFIYSYNYEQNLDTRYRQLNFAKALSQKINLSKQDTTTAKNKVDSINKSELYTSGVYLDGRLINSIKLIGDQEADSVKTSSRYTSEDYLTAKILSAFRMHLNSLETDNNNLNLLSAGKTAFFNKLNKKINDSSSTQSFFKTGNDQYLKISSLSHSNYVSLPYLSWLLLVLLITIFYYVIYSIIRKLFALDLHSCDGWEKLDGELLKDNKFNKLVFIVGSPGSNTLSKLKHNIKYDDKLRGNNGKPLILGKDLSKNNVFIADMMKISAENGESDPDWARHKKEVLNDYSLVIINHFEYNIKDPRANKIKLDLLELLKEQNTSKMIIISTVHPLIFLDSFNKQQQNPMPECERGRWHNLLGNFHVVIDPLIGSTNIPEDTRAHQKAIIQETKHSRFLHRMQRFYLESLSKQIASASLGINEKKYSGFLKFLDEEIVSNMKETKHNGSSKFVDEDIALAPTEETVYSRFLSKVHQMDGQLLDEEIASISVDEEKPRYNHFLYKIQKTVLQRRDEEAALTSSDNKKTRYNDLLHKIRKTVVQWRDEEAASTPSNEEAKNRLRDSMIFKLQLTSQYFYTDIWQSLTHEEKFILYDLAEDGLVNTCDNFNLNMLICKGLIINNDGVLMLFNQSFRNFILTANGENEMNRIKEQIKDNGRWGNLKAPLNIAILAILAFLFTSQQEAYSHIIASIGAFTAGIPVILRIFSMFSGAGKTPKTE